MYQTIAAAAVVLASAHVAIAETTCGTQPGWGTATILNKCNEPALIRAVPGGGNPGQTTSEKTIGPGESFTQQYVGLISGGWSLKAYLAGSENATLQFEYNTQTDFSGGAVLWWDVSAVNGNPWSGNWALETNDDACVPNLYAYACSEDDFKSMQQTCALQTDITLNLCEADASTPHVGAIAPGGENQALECPAGRGGIMPTQKGVAAGYGSAATSAANVQAASTYVAPTTAPAPSTTQAAPAATTPASSFVSVPYSSPVIVQEKNVVGNQKAPSPPVVLTRTHVETKVEVAVETVVVNAKRRRDEHVLVHAHHRRAL